MNRPDEWEVVSRRTMATGIYHQLNLSGKGDRGAVTVKERHDAEGAPFVCLTCLVNNCPHTRFVAAQPLPDTPAPEARA